MCRAHPQATQTADLAVAAVVAAQVQREAAVTGDQTIVVPVATGAGKTVGGQQLAAAGLGQVVDIQRQPTDLKHAAVGPAIGGQGQPAAGHQVAGASVEDIGRRHVQGACPQVQQAAALVQETAGIERQVGGGGFQLAVAIVEQPADLEFGLAAGPQCAQLSGLVVETGRADRQGAATFDNPQPVVQGTAQRQGNLIAADLSVVVTAVIKVMARDLDQALGIHTAVAVIKVPCPGGDNGIAGLRDKMPAVIVDTAPGLQVQALGLKHTALAVVVEVVAVFQHADDTGLQCTTDAGQQTTTTVDIGRIEGQVAALGDHLAALVIDIAADIEADHALALQ